MELARREKVERIAGLLGAVPPSRFRGLPINLPDEEKQAGRIAEDTPSIWNASLSD